MKKPKQPPPTKNPGVALIRGLAALEKNSTLVCQFNFPLFP